MPTFRQRVAASPLASVAATPSRVASVARYDAKVVRASARWLFTSREHTNFTYDLSALNLEHLAWWVSSVSGVPVDVSRGYLHELVDDDELRSHIVQTTRRSPRWRLADSQVRYGRRAGWCALVRALKPAHVVETGTDKGLGSVALAAALLRNGAGRLSTLDINNESGYLIAGPYAEVTDRLVGDSLELISGSERTVDFFLHDSLHTMEHETAEFEAVRSRLTRGAVVLSDNAHATAALPRWAERHGWDFSFFAERPADHWYPGAGIGLAKQR